MNGDGSKNEFVCQVFLPRIDLCLTSTALELYIWFVHNFVCAVQLPNDTKLIDSIVYLVGEFNLFLCETDSTSKYK